MKLTTTSCISLTLCAHAIAAPSYPKQTHGSFKWRSTKSLVAFGDSYTYVQGTLGHVNYTFIGDEFNFSFTPKQLFSDRIVQNLTGTAEGGPNWVEFLTECGVEDGLHDPRKCDVQLWDFAYAGANTINEAGFTPLNHHYPSSSTHQRPWSHSGSVSTTSTTLFLLKARMQLSHRAMKRSRTGYSRAWRRYTV